MPSNPEIQARAQEELDRVVGRGRWPTAEDEAKLPYIRAVIKEASIVLDMSDVLSTDSVFQVLRLHSPFWIATPHCSEEDFVYNGLYIPKNTAMVLNCYSLHHNENRYPESSVAFLSSVVRNLINTTNVDESSILIGTLGTI